MACRFHGLPACIECALLSVAEHAGLPRATDDAGIPFSTHSGLRNVEDEQPAVKAESRSYHASGFTVEEA